jgi:arylsulfatase A-like enzyme
MKIILQSLFLTLAFAFTAAAADRPNIIFIFIDDMGYGDLSCTGNKDVQTTNIDRLASEGVRFTQFYVNSPICSPSRVACTTGQYPARHLINSYLNSRAKNRARGMVNFLDPKAPAIARAFRLAGYATAHFGKWHMGGGRDVNDAPLPQAYGFDESLVSFEGLGDRILPPGGLSEASAKLGRGQIRRVEKHEQTGIYVDRAIDFVERNKSKSFYLHLWLNDVHDAFKPRADYLKKFEKFADKPELQKMYAVLKHMDDELGRLIRKVAQLGLAGETLFVVTSDNGPTAWPRYRKQGQEAPGSTAGLRGRKWSLYEGGIRMPLIVRWSGKVPAGQVDEKTVVSAVDFFPTFTSLAGVKPPEIAFDGTDMSKAFMGIPTLRKKALFWEYGRQPSYLRPAEQADQSPNLAIRDGDWKLLINDDGADLELYTLATSEREYDNVAGKHPGVAKRLSDQLLAWRKALPRLPAPKSSGKGEWKKFILKPDSRLKGAKAPKVSGNRIRVSAEVAAGGKDGVLIAHGGAAVGYSLNIANGKPVFDVRFRSELFSIAGKSDIPSGRVQLVAELGPDGAMSLSVGGKSVAHGKVSSALPSEPVDGLEVGLDDNGNVGNYQGNFVFRGTIHSAIVEVLEPAQPD